MGEIGTPADRATAFRAAKIRRWRAIGRKPPRACGQARQIAWPGEPRRAHRRRSKNWSATASARAFWRARKTREASRNVWYSVIRDPWPNKKTSHDTPSSAFQPRDLPLGLLRRQAETGAHRRERR